MLNFSRNQQKRYSSSFLQWKNLIPQERMEVIEAYYENNLLYDGENASSYWNDEWFEAMKPLRTPVNRSVDFFAAKLLMGTPKITVSNTTVEQAVRDFLKWSNFEGNKRAMLRKFAIQGNLFVKLNLSDDGRKIYQEAIDGKNVTDFEADTRGFLKWIRIDVPLETGETFTEYWTVEDGFNGYVSTWTHRRGTGVKLENLGDPNTFMFLYEMGTDFIPIVFAKFKDVGKKWGVSCVDHAKVKIDEANREITNLAEKVFQTKAYWIVETGRDNDGIALPPPDFPTISETDAQKLGNMVVVQVPGANARLAVPDYAWSEFLAIIKAQEEEIEKDLPELRYYTIREQELSGIAIRTLLAGALDRAAEAEESFLAAQSRATAMALTMGRFYGIFPSSIGNFESGAFEVKFDFAEIVPATTQSEKITSLSTLANVAELPIQVKMQLAGFTEEELALVPNNTVSTEKNVD
jgi:hypothetical protein